MKKSIPKKIIICETKNYFETESMAYDAIKAMGFKGVQGPYKCKLCDKFHITTIDKNIHQKRSYCRMKKYNAKKLIMRKFKI